MAATHFLKIDESTKAIGWEAPSGTVMTITGESILVINRTSKAISWLSSPVGGVNVLMIDSATKALSWEPIETYSFVGSH